MRQAKSKRYARKSGKMLLKQITRIASSILKVGGNRIHEFGNFTNMKHRCGYFTSYYCHGLWPEDQQNCP